MKTSKKQQKAIYWISTFLIGSMMLISAFNYFTNGDYKASFSNLGYPQYFRIELAIAKILGAIALLLPKFPASIKEWAYAGFAFTYISALVAHLVHGDSVFVIAQVMVLLLILVISHTFYHKIRLD